MTTSPSNVLQLFYLPPLDTPADMINWCEQWGQVVRVNIYVGDDGRLRGTAAILTKEPHER